MKTIVLDDDPTGTQSASDVTVLLSSNASLIERTLQEHDSVYVQTNSRSIKETDAVRLAARIRADGESAAAALHESVRFVLRGDSTLRGHVFAESDVFSSPGSVMVFVPAFPAGGRTTVNGTHFVRLGGVDVPADQTEYARDPVFPFHHADLVGYVTEKSGRQGIPVPLAAVRGGELRDILRHAPAGAVIVPDVVTNDDVVKIADDITAAQYAGREIVVRGAAPIAAALADVMSHGYLPSPLLHGPRKTLLVCGSHTAGATRQMNAVTHRWGAPTTIDTESALQHSQAEGAAAARGLDGALREDHLAILMSERVRLSAHNTLSHAGKVMEALTTAVHAVATVVEVVIAKGGITSADVARVGLGARSAHVLGQILPGVSVWSLTAYDGHPVMYIVVPGNMGDDHLLTNVLSTVGFRDAPEPDGVVAPSAVG